MSKVKGIIIAAVIVVAVVGIVVTYNIMNKFEYNEDGVTGNTNGNLYNEGLFCEYGEDVYFSNPYDNGALYKMNMDGTEFEKIYDDHVSYINIYNDYIYYKKFNSENNKDELFQRTLYGISRLKVGETTAKVLHTGKIDCMTLCGNYIYYRYYDDETLFSLRKVKIDGEEDSLINDEDYAPIAVYNNRLYFVNVRDNHNILELNPENDNIRNAYTGNFYLPDIYEGRLYYIDLDNGRKLTRMSLSTGEKTVLSEDKVINYNMSGAYGVIYYQAENSTTDHRLCRIALDGSKAETIAEGNYSKINITKNFTYFYQEIGEVVRMYRTPTIGAANVREFRPQVIAK